MPTQNQQCLHLCLTTNKGLSMKTRILSLQLAQVVRHQIVGWQRLQVSLSSSASCCGCCCSQMVVEWTTADPTTPVVMYGTSASSLTRTASATTKTYNASSMCGSPANSTGYIDPGMLHTATLSNLSYNTRYYYQYGDMVRQRLSLNAKTGFEWPQLSAVHCIVCITDCMRHGSNDHGICCGRLVLLLGHREQEVSVQCYDIYLPASLMWSACCWPTCWSAAATIACLA